MYVSITLCGLTGFDSHYTSRCRRHIRLWLELHIKPYVILNGDESVSTHSGAGSWNQVLDIPQTPVQSDDVVSHISMTLFHPSIPHLLDTIGVSPHVY